MAWGASPTATVSAALNGGGTTGSMDTSTADTIFVAVSRLTGDSPVLTDNQTNTWTLIRSQSDNGGLVSTDLYRSATPANVHATHTFTLSGGTFAALAAASWSGGATSSIDDQENSTAGTAGTTVATGSISPTADDTLVITTVVTSDGADPDTIDGGADIAVHLTSGGSNFGVGIGYILQTSATPVNLTWTFSGSANFPAATIANFKTAAGGGGGTLPHHIMLLGIGR